MKQSRNNKRKGPVKTALFELFSQISYLFTHRNPTVVGGKYKVGVTVREVVKYCVYAAMGLFLILLQLTFFSSVRPFGKTPDILIIAVSAVAMFEGERAGAIFGVLVGFVVEAAGGVGISLLPLIYMLVGYVCGIVASEYYRRSVLLFLIFDLGAAAVRFFTTLIYIVVTWASVDLFDVILGVLFPEMFSTLLISPVPALLLLPIYKIFRGEETKKPGLE